MDIEQRLLDGQEFRFEDTDFDTFRYENEGLQNYLNGEPTSLSLNVDFLEEDRLVIRFPDDTITEFNASMLVWY